VATAIGIIDKETPGQIVYLLGTDGLLVARYPEKAFQGEKGRRERGKWIKVQKAGSRAERNE